jgi:hypothetical protein
MAHDHDGQQMALENQLKRTRIGLNFLRTSFFLFLHRTRNINQSVSFFMQSSRRKKQVVLNTSNAAS